MNRAQRFTSMFGIGIVALCMACAEPAQAQAESLTTDRTDPMKILVHITHGPEAPTRAVLGFHVAKAAVDEGHDVAVFLAGDGVQLVRKGTVDQLSGLGTGTLRDLYDALVAANVPFYLSGGSSKARSLTEDDLEGLSVQFASPHELVRLSVEHDRMFTY